ncbi:Stage III sporulation protein AB [Proteiniborus sp. DW1]|uniref:stage III sporulation protein AB n=1 Tax=Proteiniborus sp. DW1 TaxID=1889883 RepID=UPI00092E0B67|nr:stage III sporulation protein AB [Proteiniborus sp. DW1]SCG83304.1 Stage III sporulation protein AB [Proteiniborus sp. DW1]
MFMIKTLACLIIILSSTTLGFSYSKLYNERLSNLINFQHCIQILETEIIYAANPLPDALKEVYNKGNKKVSYIFDEIRNYLLNNKNSNVYDGFLHIASELNEGLCFKEQDIEIILSFGRSLGISNRTDQEKYFKVLEVQLKAQQREAEEEKLKNGKMYKSLGILIGFGIVLALY